MHWIGLDWDEGPNRQSANIKAHAEAGQKLYDQGVAYYCDCTREDVDARKAKAQNRATTTFVATANWDRARAELCASAYPRDTRLFTI